MIRINNHLRKKAEERETLWEQKQAHRSNKKARSTTLEFKDPSSAYPHLNLPEFHSPPSSITRQDSEDDVSDISQPIDKEMAKANHANMATTNTYIGNDDPSDNPPSCLESSCLFACEITTQEWFPN